MTLPIVRCSRAVTAALAAAAVLGSVAVRGPAARADAPDPAAAVLRSLFDAPADAGRVTSAAFAADLPPETLGRYVSFYEKALGVPSAIAKDGDDYALTAPRGSLRATIALDADGKIASLRFHDEVCAVNADALRRLLAADRLSAAWFAPSPSRDAAVARTQRIVDGLHAALGAFARLDTRRGAYYAVFRHGETHAQISADNSGRIVYLSFERS